MAKKYFRHLGLKWKTMKVGVPKPYKGTPDGVKQSVSRANLKYAPKVFVWRRTKDAFEVERVQ
jgi:hypothetical protein